MMADPAPQPLKVEQGGAGICDGAEGDTLQLVCSGVRTLLPIDEGCPYIGMDRRNNSSSGELAGTIRHPWTFKKQHGRMHSVGPTQYRAAAADGGDPTGKEGGASG